MQDSASPFFHFWRKRSSLQLSAGTAIVRGFKLLFFAKAKVMTDLFFLEDSAFHMRMHAYTTHKLPLFFPSSGEKKEPVTQKG